MVFHNVRHRRRKAIMKGMRFSVLSILCFLVIMPGICRGDESDIFTADVPPDALITMDLSGSMNATPWGDEIYSNAKDSHDDCSGDRAYGESTGSYNIRCGSNNYVCSDSIECTGPYYKASSTKPVVCGSGRVDCSKAGIAKRAIKTFLDHNGDNNLSGTADQASLGIRVAYMRFKYCNTVEDPISSPNYNSGCNRKLYDFKDLGTNNYYSDFYNTIAADIDAGFANYTPLRAQLLEAKAYLNDQKSIDPYKNCRKKFVVFITDGWDTLACGGDYNKTESESGSYAYKRRRATIKAAKEVADAGYQLIVIGFGADMPRTEKNTLEWAAHFAGTNNPLVDDSGDTNAISIVGDPCADDSSENCKSDPSNCTTAFMDPGQKDLTGYAYLANNASQLTEALKQAIYTIQQGRISFSTVSIASARTQDEQCLFEASFFPMNNDPFWPGHIKKYNLNADGSLGLATDLGEILRAQAASSRNLFTLKAGAFADFTTGHITRGDVGVSTDQQRDDLVGYFRGEEASNPEYWKMGDVFHSNPITIRAPSVYFSDAYSPEAFEDFRKARETRQRILVVGSNDGQFRAYRTTNGAEQWSFIPPNLLPKLQYLSHKTHPVSAAQCDQSWCHYYFVDGPVSAADVWLGPGSAYKSKVSTDWRTLLIFGLGRGVRDRTGEPGFLWSSSASCDSGFYKSASDGTNQYPYYCGYYAFDVTNTGANRPIFKWVLKPRAVDAPYLGEPWSKMAIGRVRYGGIEKWAGFFGGGITEPKTDAGRGFFIVDLNADSNNHANVLWSYTAADNSRVRQMPAPPAIFDSDNDGFIDEAFAGDLYGNMWKFQSCTANEADDPSCNQAGKSGLLFFESLGNNANRPPFTSPAVAKDYNFVWIFWGTGDREEPTNPGGGINKFYGVKDGNPTTAPYGIGDLENIDSGTYQGTLQGWYINLGDKEKVLADPAVLGGVVFFTTYTPTTSTDPCIQSGIAKLYAIAMMPITIDGITYNTGAGVLSTPGEGSKTGGARSVELGIGIPQAPIFSQRPGGAVDLYVSVSGGGGQDTKVVHINEDSKTKDTPLGKMLESIVPSLKILHWKDTRIK
jgi:hypothetical protein